MLKGVGKALCAGGDVAELALWNEEGEAGQNRSRYFFSQKYKLDYLVASYTKPYVALMDGITMGGGAGLSVHAPFRIATEKTVFAMPEVAIGFFPDVGASFFLPKLDGEIGTYLALTSEQLRGVDVLYEPSLTSPTPLNRPLTPLRIVIIVLQRILFIQAHYQLWKIDSPVLNSKKLCRSKQGVKRLSRCLQNSTTSCHRLDLLSPESLDITLTPASVMTAR